MSYKLTEKQRSTLELLVMHHRAGAIDETFHFLTGDDSVIIPSIDSRLPRDETIGALQALDKAGLLNLVRTTRNSWTVTFTQAAFDVIAPNSSLDEKKPNFDLSPALLNKQSGPEELPTLVVPKSLQVTSSQRDVLCWIVEKVQSHQIDESFLAGWASDGPMIANYRGNDIPPAFTRGMLSALERAGFLVLNQTDRYSFWYTLLQPAYEFCHESDTARTTPSAELDSHDFKVKLAKFIATLFDAEDLRNICFDLGIDADNLVGKKHETKARELVKHMDARGELFKLANAVQKERSQQYSKYFP